MTRYGDVLEVSNSELQTFSDCRRQWWLRFVRGLRTRRVAPVGPLSIGSRVHLALEEGYSSPGRGAAARLVLEQSISRDVELAHDLGVYDDFAKEADLCRIMLDGFVEWAAEEGLDSGWEVVAHERIVKAPPMDFGGTPVVLKGKLDQMIRREMDGSLWMRDWKTTLTMTPVLMSFKPQVKTYGVLLALTEPTAQISGAQLVFLKKVKRTARANPPFYSVEPIYVGPRELENFYRQTLATMGRLVEAVVALEAGQSHHEVAPPRPTRDCSWRCDYYKVCEMFDDGSDVERALEDLYEVHDPYEYYESQQGETDDDVA